MSNFNKVLLIGNLTRDPQLKTLPSNSSVVEFGIATNRKWRTPEGEDREDVAFVDCAAFGRQAETIAQYMTKGKPIFVEGRLKYDSWDDKQGGGKRSKLTVVVENFQFVGGNNGNGNGGGFGGDDDRAAGAHRPASRPGRQEQQGRRPSQRPPAQRVEQPFSDNQEFKEDDIPFLWSGRDSQPV